VEQYKMAQLPEVVHRQWVKAADRWVRELGFTEWPEEQLWAVCEDLIPFPAERSPSSGRPGRHAKHGLYRRRGAGGPSSEVSDG
jgi:hypothetical protein